jgi:hypothetical protein
MNTLPISAGHEAVTSGTEPGNESSGQIGGLFRDMPA